MHRLNSGAALVYSGRDHTVHDPQDQQKRDGAGAGRGKAFSEVFVSYLLARNVRIQEDLIGQLFNSSEKRLARAVLLLARFGKEGKPELVTPKISLGNTGGDDWHYPLTGEFFP